MSGSKTSFNYNDHSEQGNSTASTVGTSGDEWFVCRRCGIFRPTLRKWWCKYLAQGLTGLERHSRRPKHSSTTKTGAGEVSLILALRSQRNLGAKQGESVNVF